MTRYIHVKIRNLEPLRIADDSISQSGQAKSLQYIPGSTVRGYVVNRLAKREDFEEIKKALLSPAVRFQNLYPSVNGHALIPSPMGFYEDKTAEEGGKDIVNTIEAGEFREGMKRAGLGRFVYFEGNTIRYYHVNTGSDLKIRMNLGDRKEDKRNVFRNEFIAPGQCFEGVIAVDDSPQEKLLEEALCQAFQEEILLGNARANGYGKCAAEIQTSEERPYISYGSEADRESFCDMMLLSDTVMRGADGEYCGLDLDALGRMLGVNGLHIIRCAASTRIVRGYNRNWGGKTPSVPMYQMGSVFRLGFDGIIPADRIRKVCEQGIGVRRNEGFGQVLFPDAFAALSRKQKGIENKAQMAEAPQISGPEEQETIRLIAKTYYRNLLENGIEKYILRNPLSRGDASSSQLGILAAYTMAYQYDWKKARQEIEAWLDHAKEKEEGLNVQKKTSNLDMVRRRVKTVIESSDIESLLQVHTREPGQVMGIRKTELLSSEEEGQLRLLLLKRLIRFDNKKEG